MATRTGTRIRAFLLFGQVLAAGLTIAMGGIHLVLWQDGYIDIPIVGVLFLFNAVISGLLAVALVVARSRVLVVVAAVGTVFTAGTLGALVLSLTTGLFGYREIPGIPIINVTIAVESAGTLVLAALATLQATAIWRHVPKIAHAPQRK